MAYSAIFKSKKEYEVWTYIARRKKIEQSAVVRHFYDKGDYKNLQSARTSIGDIISALDSRNLIIRREALQSKGGIPKKICYAKEIKKKV